LSIPISSSSSFTFALQQHNSIAQNYLSITSETFVELTKPIPFVYHLIFQNVD
jgi:hypothetical protein